MSKERYAKVPAGFLNQFAGMSDEDRAAMMERVGKRLRMQAAEVIVDAIRAGLMTADEYNEKFKGRYFDRGNDSFPEYLAAVLSAKEKGYAQDGQPMIFVTANRPLGADRERLKEKFGLEIITTKEMFERLKKEEAKE